MPTRLLWTACHLRTRGGLRMQRLLTFLLRFYRWAKRDTNRSWTTGANQLPRSSQIPKARTLFRSMATGVPYLNRERLNPLSTHYDRCHLFEQARKLGSSLAAAHGERLLVTPHNGISMAMTLDTFVSIQSGGAEALTALGGMLFARVCSGSVRTPPRPIFMQDCCLGLRAWG